MSHTPIVLSEPNTHTWIQGPQSHTRPIKLNKQFFFWTRRRRHRHEEEIDQNVCIFCWKLICKCSNKWYNNSGKIGNVCVCVCACACHFTTVSTRIRCTSKFMHTLSAYTRSLACSGRKVTTKTTIMFIGLECPAWWETRHRTHAHSLLAKLAKTKRRDEIGRLMNKHKLPWQIINMPPLVQDNQIIVEQKRTRSNTVWLHKRFTTVRLQGSRASEKWMRTKKNHSL